MFLARAGNNHVIEDFGQSCNICAKLPEDTQSGNFKCKYTDVYGKIPIIRVHELALNFFGSESRTVKPSARMRCVCNLGELHICKV